MINCSTGFHAALSSELDESKNKIKPMKKINNQILRKPDTPFNART